MLNARLRNHVCALVLILLSALLAVGNVTRASDGGTEAGTVISNRAEATYEDESGMGYGTVSPTVTVTVRSVAAINVTPDETEPSATVAPNERVTRLFRVCNTGNVPDFYTITRGEVNAPATLLALHFDTDASGTLGDSDPLIVINQTLSPRVARGACVGVLAVVDTNASQPNTRLNLQLVARSNATDVLSGATEDVGTIINAVGTGARLTSPDDPLLPPVKLVDGLPSLTAAHGQVLNYAITFRNNGDTTARNVVLRDDLPSGLDYVSNTMRLGSRALTDAVDADEGSFGNRRLELKLAQLAVGELVQVYFQARVNGSVPPGQGIINTAVVGAENATSSSSTTATAVVNPFGLVYQGRSAGTPVPGARVALLADSTTGALLPLTGTGSEPNGGNANPFASDGRGRWSFVLAPAQLGTPQLPARYFLNVTAEGYRARMIEVVVTPEGDTGLFTLTVRALDGQPIAQAGGFELVETAVSIERLAAFALNVPMFENTALEITKTVDRPTAEIGDVVSYRVELHNATAATVNDAVVRDVLPASFHYAAGTARVEVPPAAPRSIEPTTEPGGVLVFRLGSIPAGGRAFINYRVRIGANAQEGEQFNTATGTGTLTTGELVSTPTARAPVRVRRGVFSSQQIILGRVFEDANLNGQFDKGEQGVAGVRIYLNNGQSVITDSEGLYSFPSVNEGAQVLSLDPVTLTEGYALVDTGRRDDRSWTRLLRTPLGGGSLLRQNFALRAPDAGEVSRVANPAQNFAPGVNTRDARTGQSLMTGSLFGGVAEAKKEAAGASSKSGAANGNEAVNGGAGNARGSGETSTPRASGTYEMETTETLDPLAPGAVRVISPQPDETIAGAALEVEARVNGAWTVSVEVEGQRVPDSKIGERKVDRKNNLASFRFVGLNVRPGPNRIKVTAIGPSGEGGQSVELVAYGRGPAKRIEIVTDKPEIAAGGRDRARVRVRAFDQWNRPAADGAIALEVSAGRLVRVEQKDDSSVKSEKTEKKSNLPDEQNASAAQSRQQVLSLTGGEGLVDLIADGEPGETEIRATTGVLEAHKRVRVIPEVRPAILVGLAEVTVGSAAPELSDADGKNVRSRLSFFYRGQLFGENLLTLAYDSNRPLNRTAGRDRLFQLDPLERAYPIFGDSSTRFDDAQSNSKLYARLDRGRSYFLFGDFDADSQNAGLAAYTRRLTGVKLHFENANGDYVSVTGAHPDTAFARDVFAGGSFTFARLTHAEILPGSETVTIEVRDRRNPDIIISRESLLRGVDYNLDPVSGEMFFLRPISTFDFQLNLTQVVVTYEHRASGMSSAVYTGRAFKTFERLGLKLGLSFVDQRQDEFGSFMVGGIDAEKSLPMRGRLSLQYATSRGRALVGGNIFGASADGDERHDGNAYRAELEQPLPFREATLRASFVRADEGFLNPFGQTVTPGSQRAEGSVEMKVTKSSTFRFGLMDERNRTANVDNSRQTGSLQWTQVLGEKVRATVAYDFRRFRDELSGTGTDSNLLTVGAEWQATDKLTLSAKREQNLTEADPTYPDQTTFAANYQWNQFTKIFLTQRLASAPIVPISDTIATGFASVASQRETAIGVETKLGRYANLVSRYQLENGINGTDSFAVIGLQNRFALNKQLSLDLGYERGFHLAGAGESFNSGHFGFFWQPTEDFRANARYELRDRGGLGTILTFGAAGRLGDGFTSLGRVQMSRVSFGGRDNSGLSATAALAWRPLESDRYGLLFSYTRRDFTQGAFEGTGETRDRADVLSSDGYYQASKNVELYGRFALKFGDTASQEQARVSTLTYLTQGRFIYHLGKYWDVAGEGRMLVQPSSATRRNSFGAELGYWVLPDLRVGGGYNWTGGAEPLNGSFINGRRGFYFTISSKLSNLFDLFGTSRADAQAEDANGDGAQAKPKKKDEEEEDE